MTRFPRKVAGKCWDCGGWVELCWSPPRRTWACADCGRDNVWVPEPSSASAVLEGCTCDPVSNDYGIPIPDKGWIVADGCPVHDPDGDGSWKP